MSLIAKLLSGLLGRKEDARGLMLGLDASGRTTFLYRAKLGEVVTTIPTIGASKSRSRRHLSGPNLTMEHLGFNVESIECKKTQFTLWDVGGCDKIRPLWRHYYQNTQFVMFFIVRAASAVGKSSPDLGAGLKRSGKI